MIGRIFSTFLTSCAESLKLEVRYRRLILSLGWIAVAISCLALVVVMYNTWLLFGLPLEGGSIEGMRLRLISWITVTVVLIPAIFYSGMILVNGVFGLFMLMSGKFTWRQALDFALRAKYPGKWYIPDA